jgi:pimeloyl-ACP methyl ester carboxylesterase
MDTRGHGRSSLGDIPFSYALFAADAVAVLDSLHVPNASVVGWSDGGITGLYLAIDYPTRVAGLLAYGANFDHSGDVTTPPGSRFAALGQQYVARAADDYRRLSPTPDGFRALEKALGDLYAREPAIAPAALRTIRAPTTIADGDHEQFISRTHTERLAALIPDARLVIMPNVSHGGPLQDPDAFHRVVEHLLAAARSAEGHGHVAPDSAGERQ